MARVLLTYQTTLATQGGRTYRPQACGRPRSDGTWEGWLEFLPDDGSAVVRSSRETSQPNLVDLEYWATGLTPVYLEGALARALKGPIEPVRVPPPQTPVYDEPAPPIASAPEPPPVVEPVLDPFSVYVKGETLLRRQLRALSPRHLRQIIRAHDLAGDPLLDLESVGETELIAIIVAGVRARLAA